MKVLVQKVMNAVEHGEPVVLCTILASSGSSPRGAGARMAVFSDGSTCGTVGGGAVELLAVQEALDVLKTGKTHMHAFCLAPEQVASIGMICGGNVTIYFQYLTHEDLPVLYQLRHALQTDANSWLYLQIRDGNVEQFKILAEDEATGPLFKTCAVLLTDDVTRYAEPLVRAGRVYLFGGGHVGQALVPVLAGVGFRITVFDNREALAVQENFPLAEQVILGDYENIADKVTLTENDYAVIMTPGHQADFSLLTQVLRQKMRYVGCIGSRHKVVRTQQLLREAGITEEAIASIHSPIGLPILAETPAEIAISIAAEMIRCRAEKR